MYKSVTEGRFEHADLVQIGTQNGNMQRELRDLGIDFYKSTGCIQEHYKDEGTSILGW